MTMNGSDNILWLLADVRKATRQGESAISERQRVRLAELVAYARSESPFFRERYRQLPETVDNVSQLPVTTKKELMSRFDDWCTDRDVTLQKAQTFINDPGHIGERFLGKYTALTTSGTTGTRGIFVLDDRSMAVTNAIALRMLGSWLGARDIVRILTGRGRMAMVMASEGHFASTVAAARLRARQGNRIQVLSVHLPLPELVAHLNRFSPVLLAPYASVAALLASEQAAGRLHIDPVLIAVTAEGLPPREYERIARAFRCKVGNSYAATECPFFSYSCEHGWLHVNTDWVVFEPVDVDYQPVPPGQTSHTVLVSNLANRVQPILRYDLGDSILQRPDLCPCGNPLPAIIVQGRAADTLTFAREGTEKVSLPPLAFGMIASHIPGIEQFQIVQTAPMTLCVRLRAAPGVDPGRSSQLVLTSIERLLAEHGLSHVTIERSDEPPQQSAGGKFREVIPMTERAS